MVRVVWWCVGSRCVHIIFCTLCTQTQQRALTVSVCVQSYNSKSQKIITISAYIIISNPIRYPTTKQTNQEGVFFVVCCVFRVRFFTEKSCGGGGGRLLEHHTLTFQIFFFTDMYSSVCVVDWIEDCI